MFNCISKLTILGTTAMLVAISGCSGGLKTMPFDPDKEVDGVPVKVVIATPYQEFFYHDTVKESGSKKCIPQLSYRVVDVDVPRWVAIKYDAGLFEDHKFNLTFKDDGTLKSVSVDSNRPDLQETVDAAKTKGGKVISALGVASLWSLSKAHSGWPYCDSGEIAIGMCPMTAESLEWQWRDGQDGLDKIYKQYEKDKEDGQVAQDGECGQYGQDGQDGQDGQYRCTAYIRNAYGYAIDKKCKIGAGADKGGGGNSYQP